MEEKNKAELELEFIKNIIHDSRKKIEDSGDSAIMWGIIVIIGILYTYFSALTKVYAYTLWVWLGVLSFGWIVTFIRTRNQKKQNLPQTFALKVQDALWIASGISMTIIGIVCSVQFKSEVSESVPFPYIINSMAIAPTISIILGTAYYVTGYINDSKAMTRMGYGWWVGGIIMFYWKSIHHFPLFAAMMLFFQVIPGIICYKKSKITDAGE